MRSIVIAGKGSLCINAIKLARMYYENILVLPVIPEPTWARSVQKFCQVGGIPIIESGHYVDIPDGIYDMLFSVFYDKIFDKYCLDKFKHKFNLHNAPLPKYRGVNPINWALANGEKEHGVTIHKITENVDDGDVIAKTTFPIAPESDSVGDVYTRATRFGALLMEYAFPIMEHLKPIRQNESNATHYTKRDYVKLPAIFKSWARDPHAT